MPNAPFHPLSDAAPGAVDPAVPAMERAFRDQRRTFARLGPPTLAQRRDRLSRAIQVLRDNADTICAAAQDDFGSRAAVQTLAADVYMVIASLKHARARAGRWMRPERRGLDFPWGLVGARGEVRYEPLGVVGVVAPWNFPVSLSFTPLAGVFAAGNSVLLKPSELAPASADLIARMVHQAFDPTEAYVVQGGPEIAEVFTRLPFDHLLFTGSTALAPKVLHAAADNLTPVTLELGGKSPALLGRSADFESVLPRLLFGKCLNAGQICIAPDYALVPRERIDQFVHTAEISLRDMFPSLLHNPDYTGLISVRHAQRLRALIAEAKAAGAAVIELNPANEDFSDPGSRKIPPTLILDPPRATSVMREELFGPILVVRSYETLDDALDEIASHPSPLALYYFGADRHEQETVLRRTRSGGVTINDIGQHIAHESLPFGGVGASGMGRYHGFDGFRTFSNARAVFYQSQADVLKALRAPYSAKTLRILKRLIGR